MGMTKMFSSDAEFNNLLESSEQLKVSEVVHKAFIEVNEEGAEAAAATGKILMNFSNLFLCFSLPLSHHFFYFWDLHSLCLFLLAFIVQNFNINVFLLSLPFLNFIAGL
jgi:serine protease inhibitor